MTPAPRDLAAYRNTLFAETYTFAVDGAPVDITGNTLRMQVRAYAGDPGTPLVDLATAASDSAQGIFIINESQALFSVRIAQATLVAMPSTAPAPLASIFFYDLVITDPGGAVLGPVMQGIFTLYEGVTA